MRIFLVVITKISLLFVTSIIGGHGIINFGLSLFSFESWNDFSLMITWSLTICFYFLGILTPIFSVLPAQKEKIIRLSLFFDLAAFICFYLFSLHGTIDYLIFTVTSIPFLTCWIGVILRVRKNASNNSKYD